MGDLGLLMTKGNLSFYLAVWKDRESIGVRIAARHKPPPSAAKPSVVGCPMGIQRMIWAQDPQMKIGR